MMNSSTNWNFLAKMLKNSVTGLLSPSYFLSCAWREKCAMLLILQRERTLCIPDPMALKKLTLCDTNGVLKIQSFF